jgi:tricorn protease
VKIPLLVVIAVLSSSLLTLCLAEEEVLLPSGPALSPDGALLAFSYRGDIFLVPSVGGRARRLTRHPATDSQPYFSPDGSEIAFVSDRFPGGQVFVVPVRGGEPEQLTFDTNGFALLGWYPDGEGLLVRAATDRFWRDYYRLFWISRSKREAPRMLFDAEGISASLSPDGQSLLFTREGVSWWRKGYRGSQASQIWMADLARGGLTKLVSDGAGARWPLFLPGGDAFLYVGVSGGAFNLLRQSLDQAAPKPLTSFEDDSVIAPTVSRNGAVVVFRHLFDLYRLRPGLDEAPTRLTITISEDPARPTIERRLVSRAENVAFSEDGLEIAFIAGGDLFVMDTVLRQPVRVTETPEEEREPVFSPDGKCLYFVSDRGGETNLWKSERKDPMKWWWRQDEFATSRVTDGPEAVSSVSLDPAGRNLAFVRGTGKLVIREVETGAERVLVESNGGLEYSWSPDGRFLAYSTDDLDSNRDVFVTAVDGSMEAVNVSRHPYDDGNPTWSPDGKLLAFVGERRERESDIHYVWLFPKDEEESKRDRTLQKAIEKMEKGRKAKPAPKAPGPKPEEKPVDEPKAPEKPVEPEKPGDPADPAKAEQAEQVDETPEAEKAKEPEKPTPDFATLSERVQRIALRHVGERGLLFSPDGRKLAFSAVIDGKRGTYAVEFPDQLKPKLLTGTIGSAATWPKKANRILWLVGGVPTASAGPKNEAFPFSVKIERDRRAHRAAAFDLAWQTMRDRFYDPRMNGRDWNAIREKYRDAAARSPDKSTFARVVSLMLGELNASHLGFSAPADAPVGWRDQWNIATGHLGLRFSADGEGPGLVVADVIPKGPADRERSRVVAGETVLSVDGTPVGPTTDLSKVLNGIPDREIVLRVRDAKGEERDVLVRPTSLSAARGLLYREFIHASRRRVEELSKDVLGYLHVRSMDWGSFAEFEQDLYRAGHGRKGLVIDLRWNGGGFTADHLLTALTQPTHAIAVSRGQGAGYPQDRRVYATWDRPIVVLVNQDSFSNAEIFCHAIKTLGRGKLVGVTSAGGVISTGARRIMDLGTIRVPLRGWFKLDTGEDMEMNGAVPDIELWPMPGEFAVGEDRQLEKAVAALLEEVSKANDRPRPSLEYKSQR